MPYAMNRRQAIVDRNGRFVHYTSAENALKIMTSQTLWMRNARCMGDYMELMHGHDLLHQFLSNTECLRRLHTALDECAYGVGREAVAEFYQWWTNIEVNTYISSISEHHDSEDDHGRLSMWRGFGGLSPRAAIVLKLPLSPDAVAGLNLMFSPVAYFRYKEVENELFEIIQSLHGLIYSQVLKQTDKTLVKEIILAMLVMAAVSLKHEGFQEEKEWRIICMPQMRPSNLMLTSTEIIEGIPQIVYKIPLKNNPAEGVIGIEIPQIVDRVIIGPSDFPMVMHQAFVRTLREAGMDDAEKRVVVSGIPLRT
jgi:hypothetical protein